jgi:hypothetical protein
MCTPRLDDTIRAAREIGLRFHAVRGSMSAGVSKVRLANQGPAALSLVSGIACEDPGCVLDEMALSLARMQGGIAPDSVVEDEEAILRDCERCIREFHDMSRWGEREGATCH